MKLKSMDSEKKHERILIFFALIMAAVIIGYNAFFVPKAPSIIETYSDSNAQNEKENLNFNPNSNDNKENLHYNGTVNINTASEEDLVDALKGVGPAIAKRIIEYRETHGGFSDTSEIMNVKGIGEKIFEKIKSNITV